jgi:hypothetical protein
MKRGLTRKCLAASLVLPLLVFHAIAMADDAPKATAGTPEPAPNKTQKADNFLRIVRDKNKTPLSLETAIVRCESPKKDKKPVVDLVAAVHIGEKTYYDRLNADFAGYDCVLYELVAPADVKVPKGGAKSTNPISIVQRGMTEVLQLQYQLDAIDYTKNNMVHADMSPEQLSKAMSDKGESVWTIIYRMMLYSLSRQAKAGGKSTDLDLLLALFDPERSQALKRALAEQFQDMEGSISAIEGPNGSALISGRNGAALEVLKKEIDAGKRKIAIFYGAGHMPDLQQHLEKDFGLVPVNTRWLVAWDMKPKPKPAGEKKEKPESETK